MLLRWLWEIIDPYVPRGDQQTLYSWDIPPSILLLPHPSLHHLLPTPNHGKYGEGRALRWPGGLGRYLVPSWTSGVGEDMFAGSVEEDRGGFSLEKWWLLRGKRTQNEQIMLKPLGENSFGAEISPHRLLINYERELKSNIYNGDIW